MRLTASQLADLEAMSKSEGMIITNYANSSDKTGLIVVTAGIDFRRLLDFCPTSDGVNPKTFPNLQGWNGGDGDGDLFIHGFHVNLDGTVTTNLGQFECGPQGQVESMGSRAIGYHNLTRIYIPVKSQSAKMGLRLNSSSSWSVYLSATVYWSRLSWIGL